MYILHSYLPLGVIREVQGLPITDNCLNSFKLRTKRRKKNNHIQCMCMCVHTSSLQRPL